MSEQERLNYAVLYALKQGCFFPVPEPPRGADTLAWRQWGAMRYLHTAIRDFDQTGGFAEARAPEKPA